MIFLLKIWIIESRPQIWREIEVEDSIQLPEFHQIIQTVMGWTNSHLHQFSKGKKFYCNTDYEEKINDDTIDYKTLKVLDLMSNVGEHLIYEYDFGDFWEHDIELLEIRN